MKITSHLSSIDKIIFFRCLQLSACQFDFCAATVLFHRHHLHSVLHDCNRIVDVILDRLQSCKFDFDYFIKLNIQKV